MQPITRAAMSGALLATTSLVMAAPTGASPDRDRPATHVPATMLTGAEVCRVPAAADDEVLRVLKATADERGVNATVRLATFETAWVESHANNLACGDRDSLGIFQQRPSSGWGTPEQVMNASYATNAFLDQAIPLQRRNPTWSAGRIAQGVQRSAFPDRYDQVRPTAERLMARAAELGDRRPPTQVWPVVGEGQIGTRVRVVQHLLRQAGATGAADGTFGPITVGAVRSFQSARRLDSDGIVGAKTWARLAIKLDRGARGEAVIAAQRALNNQGAALQVDGSFGPATEAAVRKLRSERELPDGGTIDQHVWRQLLGTP